MLAPPPPSLAMHGTLLVLLFYLLLATSVAFPTEQALLTASILSPYRGATPIGKLFITTTATTLPTTLATVSVPSTTGSAWGSEVGVIPHSRLAPGSSDIASPSIIGQMIQKTTVAIITLSSLIAYVTLNSIVRAARPSAFVWYEEDKDEKSWIASSPSWVDRKACRWLGLCGTAHFHPASPHFGHRSSDAELPLMTEDREDSAPWKSFWNNTTESSPEDTWDDNERSLRQIPDYVLEHAPLVHLFSGEQFWPCDIAEHLYHITPTLNYTPIQSQSEHPTLQNLDRLNEFQGGHHVFLTSNDDVEDRPPWMEGEENIPDLPEDGPKHSSPGWDSRVDGPIPDDTPKNRAQWFDTEFSLHDEKYDIAPESLGYPRPEAASIREELRKRHGGAAISTGNTGGRSEAPAILLVLDKGNGIVDAFWFYFYSFNRGNVVFNVRFGNHIGDWEHCLMRFHNGQPKALFFSAHAGGEAYSYEAVEKIGRRPVIYSASGTHAMYATPGIHSYILPLGLLHDETDRGPLWDPALNAHTYTYDHVNDTLRASTLNPSSPTEWFYFNGHWGDKFYPLGDHRQYRFAGQYHYVNGPLGPRFKHLRRRKVCQGRDRDPCVIKDYIGEKKRAKRWSSYGPESAEPENI